MSGSDRRAELDRAHPELSVRRPCATLGLARSGVYHKPRSADDNDLEALRRIDHRAAVLRRPAHRPNADRTRLSDRPQARAAVDATDGDRGAGTEAAHQQTRARRQDLPVPVTRSFDRAAEPGVGGRHQCAAASGVRDGGRSPATSLQERVANHRKRRWSKAWVVSVTEKALQRRQVGDRKANTREPPFKCRKRSVDVETGE